MKLYFETFVPDQEFTNSEFDEVVDVIGEPTRDERTSLPDWLTLSKNEPPHLSKFANNQITVPNVLK